MSQPFVLGVNYWPRRKAMYWWRDFDDGEVREEFAIIRDIGMKVVRIFLLWDDFQPQPDSVHPDRLKHLEAVCDIAEAHGLGLDVTFFTGHMSGPNWAPRWLLDANAPRPSKWLKQLVSDAKVVSGSYRNPFHDPIALSAERLLLRTVVERLHQHPAIWMWNLGNEPDLFAWPKTQQDGRAWVREMTQLIKEIDTVHPVTCGLHSASLHENNGLRIDHVFQETDVAVMHAYPMYVPWARHPLDPDFVPYTCAMVTALCGKPTLMEEWGGCTVAPGEPSQVWRWTAYGEPREQFMASEDDFAHYVEQVLPRLIDVGASGAFLWCFADYAQELWDKPPCEESRHERFFGLVRPDGTLKPHAQVIKRFAAANPTVQPAQHQVNLNVSADEFYQNPTHYLIEHYQSFLKQLP